MKKLSLIFNILLVNFSIGYGMEIIPVAATNLDTLPKDLIIAIGHLLDAQDIDNLRCVNKTCQQRTLSQEEIDDNFIRAIPKAIEEDDTALLLRWKRYGARTRKIFQDHLESDKKIARFVYSQCGLVANNELELAAKHGNIANTTLLITDYPTYDTDRALTTAALYGFKDLAIILIKDRRASLPYVHKKAAQDGNIKLFNFFVELYCDLKHELTPKPFCKPKYELTTEPFFEAAAGCKHSDLENCEHKDIIRLLITEDEVSNIDGTIFKASSPCKEGIIKWLVTNYKSHFSEYTICKILRIIACDCRHNALEHCEHKNTIALLISEYQPNNINETIMPNGTLNRQGKGIVEWLMAHYRQKFDEWGIKKALSEAQRYKHKDLADCLAIYCSK